MCEKLSSKDAQVAYSIKMDAFDQNPYLFNCKNGTMHLDTMTFTEHRASDMLTKKSDVVYSPEARCERFDKFIEEITSSDTDKAKFLQKVLGYGIGGDTRYENMFFLYDATTRNGKGTLCESVLNVVGSYGCTSRAETISTARSAKSTAPSEDVARLVGVRFVNISEPSRGLVLNAAQVKSMTGNDTINARLLHENSFDFKPKSKLYINTNYLPVINDMTLFTSGRVVIIPFNQHFDETQQDKGLKTLFAKPENQSAILNWLIEGYRLQAKEGLNPPRAVREATGEYEKDSDKIMQFMDERLETSVSSKTRTAVVYEAYRSWCEENGFHVENSKNFNKAIRSKADIKRGRPKGSNSVTTLLMGYKLIGAAEAI